MYEHIHFIVQILFSFIIVSVINQNASYQLLFDLIHPPQSGLRCIICFLFPEFIEINYVVIVNNSFVFLFSELLY
jgi:hypothetical protein